MDFTDDDNWVNFFEADITSAQRIFVLIPDQLTYQFIKLEIDNPLKKQTWFFAGWLSFLLFDDENVEIGDRQDLNIGMKIFQKPDLLISYKLRIVAPYYFRNFQIKAYGLRERSEIYVNCGGLDYVDSLGRLWKADYGFTGGTIFRYSLLNFVDPNPTMDLINDPEIWAKERSGNDFSYSLPCTNGSYTVKLYFAEVGFSNVGLRIFQVKINGSIVLDNFDIFSEVGKGQGLLKIFFSQQVSDGLMNIEFIGLVDNATITAIAIF